MAGAPLPNQPYGQQLPPMPQYVPASGKRPGSTAPKVWGILLLILGGIGLLGWIMGLATLGGGGMSGSAFTPGLDAETKSALDQMTAELIEQMKGRWSFWANQGIEVIVFSLSIVAGVLLVIKPKPLGRKLAIARALVVLLSLPIAGYEGITAMEAQMDAQMKFQAAAMDKQRASRPASNSSTAADDAERKRREQQVMDDMQPIMKGIGFGAMVFTFIVVAVINSLLLFFMTRPAVKEYLESVAAHGDHAIPGYDPSMGLAAGPPPMMPPGPTGPGPVR